MTKQEFHQSLEAKDYGALAPFRVENAIILSAGFSSRFLPLSELYPKALLKVRGEVLIERQIRQLLEAGISPIYVVTGYKKEMYQYLTEQYGVILIDNPAYAVRNNNSSVFAAREVLGNSYVCCSDHYFSENVFCPYVYDSFYAARYAHGVTDEFCLDTDREGRITRVVIGGSDSYYMAGHTYWSRDFAKKYLRFLEAAYDLPETAGLYWEHIYMQHLEELAMYLQPYPGDVLHEFDNLEELCGFDSSYTKYCRTLDPADIPV